MVFGYLVPLLALHCSILKGEGKRSSIFNSLVKARTPILKPVVFWCLGIKYTLICFEESLT